MKKYKVKVEIDNSPSEYSEKAPNMLVALIKSIFRSRPRKNMSNSKITGIEKI